MKVQDILLPLSHPFVRMNAMLEIQLYKLISHFWLPYSVQKLAAATTFMIYKTWLLLQFRDSLSLILLRNLTPSNLIMNGWSSNILSVRFVKGSK